MTHPGALRVSPIKIYPHATTSSRPDVFQRELKRAPDTTTTCWLPFYSPSKRHPRDVLPPLPMQARVVQVYLAAVQCHIITARQKSRMNEEGERLVRGGGRRVLHQGRKEKERERKGGLAAMQHAQTFSVCTLVFLLFLNSYDLRTPMRTTGWWLSASKVRTIIIGSLFSGNWVFIVISQRFFQCQL